MKYFGLLIVCAITLTGCSKSSTSSNSTSSIDTSSNESALSMLHARPDPSLLAQVRSQPQQTVVPVSSNGNTGGMMLANLPAVSQASLAPPANQVVYADMQQSRVDPDTNNPGTSNNAWPFNNPATSSENHGDSQNTQVASYAPYNRGSSHPAATSGSLVPPPPAVVLSTQAQPVSFAAPIDVYGNPSYAGGGYSDGAPARSSGSLFGMGSARMNNNDNSNSSGERKHIDFVPITPTGMDARSTYKQRDDLKLLWKGALSSSGLQSLSQKENRATQELNAIVVGLPSEPTRGNLNVSQRQINFIFKAPALDKRIASQVGKLELDVAQSYYRYLYAFNKYALAQQTVAARKQEMDYADDAAERQRAAADWSSAKTDADEATDDMKSAQNELASAAGTQAARLIIGRISGVSPSADSLAQAADSSASAPIADKHSLLGSLFHFGAEQQVAPSNEGVKATAIKMGKGKGETNKSDKGKTAKRDKNVPAIHGPAVAKDLSPAPDATSSASERTASNKTVAAADDGAHVSYSSSGGVAFVLKGVSVTPRKSIIKVAVRNNGSDNFTFDPDTVGVREGLSKLPDAMVRADFDTTKVAPNEEVSGTITIFGRPWNDRLTIYLADGSRAIQMHR
jgi:hypothetical protein